MSRAFVKEDPGESGPRRHYGLPPRDDPGFDAAAAEALLEAARAGETASAEQATGYYWGGPKLRRQDRKSTRLNSSHGSMLYAVLCLKNKNIAPVTLNITAT